MTAPGEASKEPVVGGGVSLPRRVDESMTLLREVTEHPLDPGYERMARRRAQMGEGARRGVVSVMVLLVMAVVLGVMTTVAVRDLRAPQPAVARGRSVLIDRIQERSAEVEVVAGRVAALRGEIEGLGGEGVLSPAVVEAHRLDRVLSGTVAVRGPGLVVTLTDGGGGGLVDPGDVAAQARVRDADVQFVVNQLWAAGAEAVAVDDERLTSLSAIRNAGDAILVDLRPLNGPAYRIEAVGDPQEMQVEFSRSAGLGFLQLLRAEYGIKYEVVMSEGMYVPGAGFPVLRSAHSPSLDVRMSEDVFGEED